MLIQNLTGERTLLVGLRPRDDCDGLDRAFFVGCHARPKHIPPCKWQKKSAVVAFVMILALRHFLTQRSHGPRPKLHKGGGRGI